MADRRYIETMERISTSYLKQLRINDAHCLIKKYNTGG